MPLDHLALAARGACIPEPPGAITIGKTVLGRLPHIGHCTNSRLKHNSSLLVKKVCLLVLELQPEKVKLSIIAVIT